MNANIHNRNYISKLVYIQAQSFGEVIEINDIIPSLENLIIELDKETKLNNKRHSNDKINHIFESKNNQNE